MRTIDMQIKTNIENTTKQQKQPHVNKLPCNLIMFMVYFEQIFRIKDVLNVLTVSAEFMLLDVQVCFGNFGFPIVS